MRYASSPYVLVRAFGLESVLYHTQAGTTHLLDVVGTEIWNLLAAPQSAASIARQVADRLECELVDEFSQHVCQLLTHLVDLNLVETIEDL